MLDGETRALHELAFRAGHTALVIGGASVSAEAVERVAGEVRAAVDAAIVEEVVAVPECAWSGQDVVLVVVRPDGHVGLRAESEHAAALRAYQSLLTRGATAS